MYRRLSWHREEWRPVPGWELLYQASTYGRVRSLYRGTSHPGRENREGQPKEIVGNPQKNRVLLLDLKKRRRWETSITRVVWVTYFGEPPPGARIQYVDGDRRNKRPGNLTLADSPRRHKLPTRKPFEKFHPATHPHLYSP